MKYKNQICCSPQKKQVNYSLVVFLTMFKTIAMFDIC